MLKKYKPVKYKGFVIFVEIHNKTVYQLVEKEGVSVNELRKAYQKDDRFLIKYFIKGAKEEISEYLGGI